MSIKFYKISEKQFNSDFGILSNQITYSNIKLPKRATSGSAGYDFFAPYELTASPGETIKFPTGIRVEITTPGVFLALFPRSSLGFKYKFQLDNTVGIIDQDYFYSDNEGHIWAKFTNWSDKPVVIPAGQAYMQGIFINYALTDNDNTTAVRNGGFGSTN